MSGSAFDAAFAVVVGAEAGFTNDPGDPGNWTGGVIGAGQCSGTKFGISAAAYPTMDIADLTVDEAKLLYARDYWTPIQGDALRPALALIVFDAAVNSGVRQAGVWLQVVLGVATDGAIGPETLAAAGEWSQPLWALCAEVLAQRLAVLGMDSNFATFGLGWSRRCARLAFQAATML